MKTTIEFKDGHVEVVEDGMPVCMAGEEQSVGCIDSESVCLTDDVPLNYISRIIFEND